MARFKLNKKTTSDVNNVNIPKITKSAVLCCLNTKAWGNTKKIPIEKLNKITNKKLSDRIRSNKSLIDKDALANINSCITKARNVVKAHSLPFPLDGIFLVPKDEVMVLTERLDEVIAELKPAIDEFESDYDEYIKEAEENLGPDFFDENDYPANIKERFDINYRFLDFSIPDSLSEFSPELYEKEKRKLQETFNQTRNDCILFLRKAFVEELKSIVNVLTGETEDGKKKIIRQDTLEKIDRFFESFKSKNIFDDKELMDIVSSTKDILDGISAKDVRTDDELRNELGKELSKVAKEAEKNIVSFRRKITL